MRERLRRATRREASLLVASVLLLVLVVAGASAPVPYVRLGPGPTFDTLGAFDGEPLVEIKGARTYPTEGRIDMTTVTESGGPYGDLGLAEALRGWLDPDVAVIPRRLLYPDDRSGEEVERANLADFAGAERDALAAALGYLDLPVRSTVVVESVGEGTPADGLLEEGDVVRRVDGTAVRRPERLVEVVRGLRPGRAVEVVVERDGERRTVEVVPGEPPDDRPGAYLGVTPTTGLDTGDIEVEFGLEDVGGPSAGLAFALSIVDQLTPGPLTGGAHVAVTGTIDPDGTVGPIGGVQQKLVGAKRDGATVFLVPAGNCAAAAGATPSGLRTVKVESLEQAVESLEALAAGGERAEAVPSC